MFGLLRSSRSTGLTICLTEMRRTSSAVRNEKDMLFTVEGYDLDMFMFQTRESNRPVVFGPDEIDRGRRSRGQGADAIDLGSTLAREIVRIDAQFSHTRDPRANGSLTEIVARSPRRHPLRRDDR